MADVINGATRSDPLEIRRSGEGAPLVLVHGIQGTCRNWMPVAARLHGLHCVVPNLPGREGAWRAAESEAASCYHVDHFADLVHALIEREAERTGQRVAVAGWSMGVSVLLRVWERHGRGPIARMALLSGTPLPAQASWFRATAIADIGKEAYTRAVRLGLSAAADPVAVAWSLRSARGLDQRTVLSAIDCPTLVLHGAADEQSPPAHGRLIAQGIAGAQWVELAEVGHAVLTEAEVEVAASLQRFFLGKIRRRQ